MIVALLLGAALAQDGTVSVPTLNAQLYRQPIDAEATLWTDDAGLPEVGSYGARAGLNYVNDPLVFVYDGPEKERVAILSDALQLGLSGYYTLPRVRLGLDVPLYLMTASQLDAGGGGLGDMAVDVKGIALPREEYPVGLAFGARLILPTATVNAPVGYGGVGYEIQAIADKRFDDLLAALNIGYRGSPRVELDNVDLNDQIFFRLGGGYALSDAGGVSLDLAGQLSPGGIGNRAANPLEVLVGGWGRATDELVVRGGLGTGLTSGIGSAQARVVLSIAWQPKVEKDADLDGLVDAVDACPADAEDKDGFQDEDGCPDLDNDADGFADVNDECPLEAEDVDDHQDDDGCPEDSPRVALAFTDPDGNPISGIELDIFARNPHDPQDPVGIEVRLPGRATNPYTAGLIPGQYRVVATAEGYEPLEKPFRVPDEPQVDHTWVMKPKIVLGTVRVEVADPSGTPIAAAEWSVDDKAFTPIAGGKAAVQLPPGNHAVRVRADGYASIAMPVAVAAEEEIVLPVTLQPAKVKITKEKIEIGEKVYFETGKADIKPESYAILGEVGNILKENPDILQVRVEGHTDSRGADHANLTLSQARAESVAQFLVDMGILRERLLAVGFGEDRPVDAEENEVAWEKNRRVEFVILEREGAEIELERAPAGEPSPE